MFDLTGKKAVVTGGARGLGKGIATALGNAGAEVVLIDISNQLDHIVQELKPRFKVHSVYGDLSTFAGREEAFQKAISLLNGKVDILVNSAGIHDRRACFDLPVTDFNKVMEINHTAVYHACQFFGKTMVEQGSGKMINLASMLTFFGGFNATAYAASKGAVGQLTKSLSNEWAGYGVQVNAIAPGYMATEMNKDLLEETNERLPQINARIPARRWGTPEDVGGAAVFLASDAANYVSGVILPVDGGYAAR
ncbi:glucose 1-dehydrogenase [Bacillus sp. FSL K6-6483]|uniref:glucose 1-dehydrogenase n=1 Tax=Shouchella TaxID=2893057 RepID=UPI00203E2901|nr:MULTISPECIES: glucose 1-dehydrogenase [Shouchella]MCM3311736.1 glucose 1-dehydrogenase [Psychrobacillus sp. MER TA 17]MCM3381120.1 glucose 1-dehydrogenase [Shouchella rhizosphaerae]MDO7269362.1 glucose 1-dehydrogenase [Shouchella clausii]MDO7289244.1 glucose 1-dehydrogenase [Shouchella clausii]